MDRWVSGKGRIFMEAEMERVEGEGAQGGEDKIDGE